MPDKDLAIATIKHLKSTAPTVRNDDVKKIKKLCYTIGVTHYQAVGEADDFLAYLSNKSYVDYVISPDMDILSRNVSNLLVPESNIPRLNNEWKCYNLQNILTMMTYTYDQFITFCVLIGCDYTYGVPSVNPRFAYSAVKEHNTIALSWSALGGNVSHVETLEKGYGLLFYKEKDVTSLLGMSSTERFTSDSEHKSEIEHIDELDISSKLKEDFITLLTV